MPQEIRDGYWTLVTDGCWRFAGDRHFNGQIKLHKNALALPLGWRKPRQVFVNSMSDLFHRDVPFEFVDKVFAVMALTPQHTYQILTKRPERMAEYLSRGDGWYGGEAYRKVLGAVDDLRQQGIGWIGGAMIGVGWPLRNVWLGTSVENQATADERIPHLLRCPAAVRFLSCEPLLGAVDVSGWLWPPARLHWVIVGGESGPNARPMHPTWARSLRDQCQAAGVAFFFKQWGEFSESKPGATGELSEDLWLREDGSVVAPPSAVPPGAAPMVRVGKKAAGRLLDGREWNELPEGRS